MSMDGGFVVVPRERPLATANGPDVPRYPLIADAMMIATPMMIAPMMIASEVF